MPVALGPATPENLEKARRTRAAKRAAHAALDLKRDWLDAPEWDRLAGLRGLRQPSWNEPCTPGRMRTYLGRVGLSATEWLGFVNLTTLARYRERNPRQPLRAWLGTVLEALTEGRIGAISSIV